MSRGFRVRERYARLTAASKICAAQNAAGKLFAHRWNFGLCATIPRKPRQARKGATVADQLRAPRITRSSFHTRGGPKKLHGLSSDRAQMAASNISTDCRAAARHADARKCHPAESAGARVHFLRHARRGKNNDGAHPGKMLKLRERPDGRAVQR